MIRRRILYYGGGMAAYIFVVAGLFALVNFISAKNYRKADFTSGGRHSLSQQTTTLVGRLPYEIKTLAFVKDAEGARASNKHLLQQYEDHGKNFKWEFVDPDKKPGIAKEHGVTQYNTFVVLGREGKKETITGELSEEKLTNALFRLIATKEHAVYFTKGHGERDINEREQGGYEAVRSVLFEQSFKVGELSLTTDEASDVSAVVIVAGPLKSFLEPEKKKIDAFIRGGGKVLFLTGSFSAQILGPWLEKYGVTLDNDVIVDRASRIMGGDILAPMVTTYEQHPITNGFKLMTFFPLASSLRVKNGVAGVTAVELAKTRTDTWGETDEAGLKKGVVQFDEGKDFQGPLAVAVVAEVASPAQDKEGKPVKGAVVVVADSEFASNSFLNVSGNKDLFMNIVNWLSSEEDRVTISSHNSDSEPLIFKSSQLSWMVAISVLGIPAMVFLAGLWANLRRRRNS